MALDRTTIWICDICEARETRVSTDDKKGLDEPFNWEYRTIHVSAGENKEWVRQVLMCNKCLDGFLKLYSLRPEAKAELKKPFWQKAFGRPDETRSGGGK